LEIGAIVDDASGDVVRTDSEYVVITNAGTAPATPADRRSSTRLGSVPIVIHDDKTAGRS
jgi:hypothetical protein